MLSVAAIGGGGRGDYYLDLAVLNYHLSADASSVSRWHGEGARLLGVSGRVRKEELGPLLQGFAPDRRPLIQNAGERNHQPGWDCTFSAPKSVSVLWACAPDATREEVLSCHRISVDAALRYLQDVAAFTRRGKGGRLVERSRLVVATFDDATSRAGDPALHTHCLVLNVGVRADGTTGTILSKPLYLHKMAAGALYRAELAAQLQQRLGVACEPDGTAFKVRDIPDSLVKSLSKRRAAIEATLDANGLASAAAAAAATLATRGAKKTLPPLGELLASWQQEAREHGLDLTRVIGRPQRTRDTTRLLARIIDQSLREVTKSTSHFAARDLRRTVAQAAQSHGISADVIRKAVSRTLTQSPAVVRLGNLNRERRYTTAEVYALERDRLIAAADRLGERRDHGVGEKIIDRVLGRYETPRSAVSEELRHHAAQLLKAARRQPTSKVDRPALRRRSRFTLSDEQKAAVRHLTAAGRGNVRFLEGGAGTGKTATLAVVREVWQKQGLRVIGVALAGKAARELRSGSGIESVTLAMLLRMMRPGRKDRIRHHARQILRAARGKKTYGLRPLQMDGKTVLVVDEAGMLATHQFAELLRVAETAGALLVAVGDRRQLPAIERGGAFAFLADRIGRAILRTVLRQKDARDVQAVTDIADGRAARAIRNLAARGLVTVSDNRPAARAALVSDWARNERDTRDKNLIFAGTNAEAHDINQLCQAARLHLGELSTRHRATTRPVIDPRSKQPLSVTVYRGDRVLFTEGSRTLGVTNGDTGTVTAIRRSPLRAGATLSVRLDDGRALLVPLASYRGLRLGYAVTTHKGQGTTVDRAYVLAGGRMQDRELSYVQASRARLTTRLYVDRNEAGPRFAEIARQMSVSREKTLAHDVERRVRVEQQHHQQQAQSR
jgi:conjugative relaxase-like TrwC/TraI family protein